MKKRKVLFLITACLIFSAINPAAKGETDQAMNRGLAAARQEQWEIAIKYFEKAREAEPASPEAVFNLALANDKAGGRELPAILWYRAYLIADPDAENAAEVNDRIIELEVKVEVNAGRFLAKALETVPALDERIRSSIYASIIGTQILTGGIKSAFATLEKIPASDTSNKTSAYSMMIEHYVKMGELASARDIMKKAVEAMKDKISVKNDLLAKMAATQASMGQIAEAKKTAEEIDTSIIYATYEKAYLDIIKKEAFSGDIEGAKKCAKSVIKYEDNTLTAYCYIAEGQIMSGDKKGALLTLAEAKNLGKEHYAEPKDKEARCGLYDDIGVLYVKAGDIESAKEMLERLKSEYKGVYYKENEDKTWTYLAGLCRKHIKSYIDELEELVKKDRSADKAAQNKPASITDERSFKLSELSSIAEEKGFLEVSNIPESAASINRDTAVDGMWGLRERASNLMVYLRRLRELSAE